MSSADLEDDVEGLPMEGELEAESPEQEEEKKAEPTEEHGEHKVKAEEEPEPEAKADEPDEEEEEPQRHKQTSKERREKRRQRERRIREERDFYLQQNNELMQRLAVVETGTIANRIELLDTQERECSNDANTAESLELDAQQQGDWEGVRQARKLRDAARERANLFKQQKDRLNQIAQQRQAQPVAPPPGAAEIQRLSAEFRQDKPWLQFGANGVPLNRETEVALSIDRALKGEGRLTEYDPGYWQELDKRVKAAIPHAFRGVEDLDDDDDEGDMPEKAAVKSEPKKTQVARKGPSVGSSGNQGASGPTRKRVSPERVAALKEIGVWDDPKLRAEYLAEYDKFDKEHGVTQ